jgi:hypothetical protein
MRVSKPPTKWIFRIIGLSGYPSSRIALSLGGVGLCQSALEQSEYILWPFRAHHSIDSVTWSKLCTSLGVRTAQVFYRFLCPGFGRRRTVAGRATFLTPSRPSSRLISEVAWSAKASHTTQSAPPQREQKQMPARPSCLLIGILLSHSGWPAGRLLAPSENPGSGTRLVGEISNERAGYLHFHGFFAFAYFWCGLFAFNFISTRNHRAVAKRSDAVPPGMARSCCTPVRRISKLPLQSCRFLLPL